MFKMYKSLKKKLKEAQFYSAENESDESLPNLAAREHVWEVELRIIHPALWSFSDQYSFAIPYWVEEFNEYHCHWGTSFFMSKTS